MKAPIPILVLLAFLILYPVSAEDTCTNTTGVCATPTPTPSCSGVTGVCVAPTPTPEVPIVYIMPRDNVYYGDYVSLDGLMGWANTLAWWNGYNDPTQDPPDAFINVTPFTYRRLLITEGTQAGMWYWWYGHNEDSPTAVFNVIPRERFTPVLAKPTPTPTPGQATTRPQPAAIADYLVANGDNLTMKIGIGQVWFIGPTVPIMGKRTVNGTFIIPSVDLAPGEYEVILQAPDANAVYEVTMGSNMTVDSVWKGVPGFSYAGLSSSVFRTRLMAMFNDQDHFHGKISTWNIIVEDQAIDVTSMETAAMSKAVIRGLTNLAAGDVITVIWDEDLHPLRSDRLDYTTTAKVTGDDVGAYRVFVAIMPVNLNTQAVGNHHVNLYTPDGHRTTIEFYVGETWVPYPTPQVTLHYINNSPFLPTPTPIIIEKEVPVTVHVTVPVTPPYETVLMAQRQAAREAQDALLRHVFMYAGLACFAVCGLMVARYLASVVKRARVVKA